MSNDRRNASCGADRELVPSCAPSRSNRCGDTESEKIEIEECIFAVPDRAVFIRRDDPPASIRFSTLRETCGMFHVLPVARHWTAMSIPRPRAHVGPKMIRPRQSQQHHCAVCAGLSAQRERVW